MLLCNIRERMAVWGGRAASGNTSCGDHNIAWRIREKLHLDKVRNGPNPRHNDEMVYDVGPDGRSRSGWGHPRCGGLGAAEVAQVIPVLAGIRQRS